MKWKNIETGIIISQSEYDFLSSDEKWHYKPITDYHPAEEEKDDDDTDIGFTVGGIDLSGGSDSSSTPDFGGFGGGDGGGGGAEGGW